MPKIEIVTVFIWFSIVVCSLRIIVFALVESSTLFWFRINQAKNFHTLGTFGNKNAKNC